MSPYGLQYLFNVWRNSCGTLTVWLNSGVANKPHGETTASRLKPPPRASVLATRLVGPYRALPLLTTITTVS